MIPEKVNLAEKFSNIGEYWSPKIAGEINDTYLKLVKFQGEFVWHHHENEDELFLVVKGRMLMRLRNREVWVGEVSSSSCLAGWSTCLWLLRKSM